MPTPNDAKTMAKSLRNAMVERQVSLSHSDCLEIVARQFGYADWNTLSAKLLVEEQSLTTDSKPAAPISEVEKKHDSDGASQASSVVPWTACSFCGKSRQEVQSLIGGCGDWKTARERGGPERSTAFICLDCVTDAAELMKINSAGT